MVRFPKNAMGFAALSALLAAVFLLPAHTFAAFGISPPFLNAGNLVASSKYVQTVYLVQDQPNQDLKMRATLAVPETIRPWIHVDTGLEFVIPQGTRQFPVEVTVEVPKDAGLGRYSGNLTFVNIPDKAGQVTIALGANVAINLTVGTGIFEKFSVPLVKLLDIEEGWNPRVYVKFNNEGNIPESFDGATFELLDRFGGVRLAYIQKNSDFPETPAFTVKEYTAEFPTDFHLGLGQYWGDVSFYQREKVVAHERTVFSVLSVGSLATPGSRIWGYLKSNAAYAIVVFIIVVLALARFIVKRKRKK